MRRAAGPGLHIGLKTVARADVPALTLPRLLWGDQFTGFHGIVIPGTLCDSLFILAGLLEQQTSLDTREIMADTHGYSEVVFGLFALLRYRFSPRLGDLADQRFWRRQKDDDYGPLNALSRHVLNSRLLIEHWDDMLRLAGSFKLDKVKATAVLRTLQRAGSWPSWGGRRKRATCWHTFTTRPTGGASWCNSTGAKGDPRWPAPSFTA